MTEMHPVLPKGVEYDVRPTSCMFQHRRLYKCVRTLTESLYDVYCDFRVTLPRDPNGYTGKLRRESIHDFLQVFKADRSHKMFISQGMFFLFELRVPTPISTNRASRSRSDDSMYTS